MKAKVERIIIDNLGSYLGMEKGCFVIKDRKGNVRRYSMFENDSHIKTRLAQYEAFHNGKGIKIAKTIVESKIESQNMVLKEYSLRQLDITTLKAKIERLESKSLKDVRKRLLPIEGL
ncbi:MAG: CRISPR-associated endonuclease Cas1 [Candidatus Bathyarchaeia archaeon]